nr:unnamed protein product [Naegleria fowleri]
MLPSSSNHSPPLLTSSGSSNHHHELPPSSTSHHSSSKINSTFSLLAQNLNSLFSYLKIQWLMVYSKISSVFIPLISSLMGMSTSKKVASKNRISWQTIQTLLFATLIFLSVVFIIAFSIKFTSKSKHLLSENISYFTDKVFRLRKTNPISDVDIPSDNHKMFAKLLNDGSVNQDEINEGLSEDFVKKLDNFEVDSNPQPQQQSSETDESDISKRMQSILMSPNELSRFRFNDYSNVFCTHNFIRETYRACLAYNLCYRRGKNGADGEYIYFQNIDDYSRRSTYHYDSQGFGASFFKDGSILAGVEGRTNWEVPQRTWIRVKVLNSSLSEYIEKEKVSVGWVTKRSVLLKRHRCTNAAHCMTETIYPAFALMREFWEPMPFGKDIDNFRDVYLVFAEEEDEECDCAKDMLTCGTDKNDVASKKRACQTFSRRYGSILSKHPNQLIRTVSKENDLTCFTNVVMGSTSYGLFGDLGFRNVGGYLKQFRDLIYQLQDLKIESSKTRIEKKTLVLTIYNKRRGFRRIERVEELYERAKEAFSTYTYISKDINVQFNVKVSLVTFETLSFEDQVQLMYDTDVFLSPFGSASFNSILMSSGAVLLTFPNGYEPDKISSRIYEHDLFHGHMWYQNLIYPSMADEIYFPPHAEAGSYLWKWEKMKVLITTALNMRIHYLMSTSE